MELKRLEGCSEIYNSKIKKNLTEDIFNTSTTHLNKMKEKEEKLMYNLPFDLYDIYVEIKECLVKHILEVRDNDCYKVFFEGLNLGIDFQKFLQSNK